MARETLRSVKTEQSQNELKIRSERVLDLENKLLSNTDPSKTEELQLDMDIAKEEYEFYKWERDITGAKKGDRFGVELRDSLLELGVGRNEQGELKVDNPEALDRTHLILVNMGELDRLNASGEHALGDIGLGLVYEKIQQVIAENLNLYLDGENIEEKIPTMFEVYRVGSNDFTIILKDVNENLAKKITSELEGMQEMPEESKKEAVPLTANTISLRNSYQVLESLRSVFGKEDVNEFDKEDAEQDDKTLLITLLKERLFTMSEFVKIRSRLERMVDKIKNPQGISAEDLYNKYLVKSLGNVFAGASRNTAMSFVEFKTAIKERGASLESGKEDSAEWERTLFLASRDESIRLFQEKYDLKRKIEVELQKQIIADLRKRAEDENIIEMDDEIPDSVKNYGNVEYGEAKVAEVKKYEERMQVLGITEGKQIFGELDAKLKEAEANNYSDKLVKLAKLKLEVEKLKRDSATGLKGRGLLFGEMMERLKDKKPFSVISIDMAFLKFFDREGGKKTGDEAILAAGKVLDFVKRKYTDKGAEAYRVGGDEFVFTVNEDDKELVQGIIQDIREVALEVVKRIPAYKGGTDRYRPELLQFNFGYSGYSADKYPNLIKPDDLVHEADARVEIDKAVNRFVMLLQKEDEINRLPVSSKDRARADLDVLYAYSAKSIFGNDGKEKIQEWAQEYRSGSKSLKLITSELIEFIAKGLKDKDKKNFEQKDLEHVLLRNELIIEMQHAEISKLHESLEKADREAEKDHERIAKLKERLNEAEADRDKVIRFRQELA